MKYAGINGNMHKTFRNQQEHARGMHESIGTMYGTCGNKHEHALNKQELTGICMRCSGTNKNMNEIIKNQQDYA